MKFQLQVQTLFAAGLAVAVQGHSIFQKISINGVEQAQLDGFRAPSTNNPIMDVTTNDIICQAPGSTSTNVVDVPAGAKVGTYWGHVIGGEEFPGDIDNPIASSHKGPMTVYMAKVDNAATTPSTGLKWFKVAEEGFNTATTQWAVDTMIAGGGWWYFTRPSCLTPGNYLMRAEVIALHGASAVIGAQFYISCVQINLTGGGAFTAVSTVSFPGAYSQTDPSIEINIYGSTGQPDNDGKPYAIPGPALISCSGQLSVSMPPTTLRTTTRATSTSGRLVITTSAPETSTSKVVSGGPSSTGPLESLQTLFGQCGGSIWTGPTACAQGTCQVQNSYYSQCLN
ncbi:Endoglucanase-4 [Arthrobotrys entomopaga]|nr:Endoglucanase-4 [Arthrobotrys entomopaga]